MQHLIKILNESIYLLLCICLITSCKKESTEINYQNGISVKENEKMTQKLTFEQVDRNLLQKYIDYQLERERDMLLLNAGKSIGVKSKKLSRNEINSMINNFLANERNILRLNKQSSNMRNPWWWEGNPLSDEVDDLGNYGGPIPPVTGNINGTGNTITVVITMNGTAIQTFDYSVGGLHGTITSVGTYSQQVFNGVTTYQMTLAGSWAVNASIDGGVGSAGGSGYYTTNVQIYGNIYNGVATVSGIVLTPNP